MATEDPMQLPPANGIQGAMGMVGNGASAIGIGTSSSSTQDSITKELGMLLRNRMPLDNLLGWRDPGYHRSGSAPPSVEVPFSSIGGLRANQLPGSGENDIIDSEQELRSDPAYLVYYYSHVNLNPRLPPPLVTRENYHLAQRLVGDKQTLKSFDESNSRSSFFSQPSLPTHNEEPEFCDDEKFPMGDLLKQLHGEPLYMKDGFVGLSQGTRPKSLVDLIQEDFPRTPSPVFTQARPSNYVAEDENIGLDGQLAHLRDSSVSAAAVAELSTVLLGSRSTTPNLALSSHSTSSNPLLNSRSATPNPLLNSRSATPAPSVTNTAGTLSGPPGAASAEGTLTGVNAATVPELAASFQNLGISERSDVHSQNKAKESYGSFQCQSDSAYISHVAKQHQQQKPSAFESQNRPRGNSSSSHPQSTISSVQFGAPSNIHTAAAAAATATATTMSYMARNPYYSNLHSYSPSYNRYLMDPTFFPSMMTSYPSSMPLDSGAGVAAGAAAAAAMATGLGLQAPLLPDGSGVDMQQFYKCAGQGSSPLMSQMNDPLYYHYLQQYIAEDCRNRGTSMDSSTRGYCMDSMEIQKGQGNVLVGYHKDQKSLFPSNIPYGSPMGSKNGSLTPCYGSPPGVGFVVPYGNSTISSPALAGPPILSGGLSAQQGDRNFRFAPNTNRISSEGPYMGWGGLQTGDVEEELKSATLLDEFKNSKARRFELSDILGHVVEFSADQYGSRFIQQKLETVTLEEKTAVFKEVLPHALSLMTDVFGNYVIQKFFEHGSQAQRSELAEKLVGRVLSLSLQMYGCRVIQKALEVLAVEQQIGLISELDGQVMRCVKDQNGNHVIQKCIECVPPEHINFILLAFHGQILMLSTHPYGCRVIQRVLEHCTENQKQNGIMAEILRSVCILAQDQYGNYVVQHILEHGKPEERSEILTKMAGQIVQMSQHKFASNVVEKCLEFSGPAERQILITEMLGQTDENEPLQAMMKDQFANYVVQKVLETCDNQQREMLLSRIRVHLHGLKKYTYGKHIVARVEKLIDAGERRGATAALMSAT